MKVRINKRTILYHTIYHTLYIYTPTASGHTYGRNALHTAPHTPTQDGERRNALRYTRRPSFLNTQNSGVETRWRGGCRLYYIYSSLFMYYEDF